MSFLEDIGISLNTIQILEENCTNIEKKEAYDCCERIFSSIRYLRSIGVLDSVIENILIEDHHILIPGEKYLKRAISKVDEKVLVSYLNNNVNYMYYLKDFI